ncbi:ribosomal RNA small subunit methyltransferase A [bacterium]|nr:ribosomal RNA small subunit methyltransferase A [bacterium]
MRQGLKRAKLRPSRAKGQHFLIDDSVLAVVVEAAALNGEEHVVEIGPGLGTLTRALAARCHRLHTYELDERLLRYLRAWVLAGEGNVVLHDVAFNKYVLEDVIAEAKAAGRPLKIVTNLPYQISSAFLHTVVDYAADLALVVVMLQREVAQRTVAGPGDPGYSSFSLYLQTFLSVRWVCDVPAVAFYPLPKVDSAVIAITPLAPDRQPQPRDRELYLALVEGVFRHRRKQIINALALAFPQLEKDACASALAESRIDPVARPQDLAMRHYIALSDCLISRQQQANAPVRNG